MSRNLRELGIKRREQIYQFIIKYINDKGYAPSIREIADAVGLKSSSSIHAHLMKLEEEGRIEMKPRCPRTIKVLWK